MSQNEPSSWLRELQQKSWEPEILLSGIVLYGMFQIPDLLDDFLLYFQSNIEGSFGDIKNMVAILKVSVYWLIAGLIIHLFSRGIWIGFVGLSYTFPQGIRPEKLKYKGAFQDKVESIPSLESIVDRLEKICSSIFSTSFMLFMAIVGGYSYIFFLLALPYITLVLLGVESGSTTMFIYRNVYTYPIVVVGIFTFIDFVSLGALKRVKWLTKIYWPLHRFASAFTLSRFYRNIYYVFVGHVNRWLLGFLLLGFTVCSFYLIPASHRDNESAFSNITLWKDSYAYGIPKSYYDNMNADFPSRSASIQSDIITGNTLKLFIAADVQYEELIKKKVNYDSLLDTSDLHENAFNIKVVEDFYQVYVDDSLLTDTKFYYYSKTLTGQKGYISYLNIERMKPGMHTVAIGPPGAKKSTWAEIKFYRE